jgi:hypothetical protein
MYKTIINKVEVIGSYTELVEKIRKANIIGYPIKKV